MYNPYNIFHAGMLNKNKKIVNAGHITGKAFYVEALRGSLPVTLNIQEIIDGSDWLLYA